MFIFQPLSLAHDVRFALFNHDGIRGSEAEIAIRSTLANLLGSNAIVSGGEIFTSDMKVNCSRKQIDIIVSASSFPPLPPSSTQSSGLFLAEGVRSIIEVKSNLTSGHLSEAIELVMHVRSGLSTAADEILFGLIGFDSTDSKTGRNRISLVNNWIISNDNSRVFDFILILNYGIWIQKNRFLWMMDLSETARPAFSSLVLPPSTDWYAFPREGWKHTLIDIGSESKKQTATSRYFAHTDSPSSHPSCYQFARDEYKARRKT